MRDRLFSLFFLCTIIGTFTSGFVAGKHLQNIHLTSDQVNRIAKADKPDTSIVAKNP